MEAKSRPSSLADEQIDALNARYGITLSEPERKLLSTPKDLLGPYERQHRFILGMDLEPAQCPACLATICTRSADPAAAGGTDFSARSHDEDHWCPSCKRRLVHQVYLFGGQGFVLHPDEALPAKRQ